MTDHDDILARLAQALGIAAQYRDAFGDEVRVSPETMKALLAAFGLDASTPGAARDSLERIERRRLALLPGIITVETGSPVSIPLQTAGATDGVSWRLTSEDGSVSEGRSAVTLSEQGFVLELEAIDAGYHQLWVEAEGETAEALVISAPPLCWWPDAAADGGKLWGVTAQVNSLRSRTNLGIGDFTDIRRAASQSGKLGAAFFGLSPLHALFSADRSKFSPYSPSSRLFLETLYLDPTQIPGFKGSTAAAILAEPQVAQAVETLRGATLVDHRAVWEVKRPLLESLWADFQKAPDPEFEAWRVASGIALERHATFEALSEHFVAQGHWWMGEWPAAFHDSTSAEVSQFADEKADRVGFHAWMQWHADRQMARAAADAKAAGMPIGLYRDLAVGPDGGGSEVWAHRESFAASLSVGAPPDPLGPHGQNWGLPPLNPLAMEDDGLAAFRRLVQANMRYSGALRIDHAFQLRRLFVIPSGAQASEGGYIDYPFEAMLAVLRLESHRHQCLVIAEDLGTAPEGFSDAIMASGILSYRLLPFERGDGGTFKRPDEYPTCSMATGSTHDLPTLRGWWTANDVNTREMLGLFDQQTADNERGARAHDREKLAEALHAEGLQASTEVPVDAPVEAITRYLARTRSMLTGLQLEDAAGELNQANLPGVSEGHPNWRRRLGVDLETLLAPGGSFARLAAANAVEGRGEMPSAALLVAPPPRATYRLQFHKGFTFDDARAIVPYLKKLGISHIHSSPIHQARPGSTHGYDIVDHTAINPELGGEEAFLRLSESLKAHDLKLILDIVPNHMGVGGADNSAWLRMLEWGEIAAEARWFDVDWGRLGANGKVVIPFLGDRYGDALEKGELKLTFDATEGSFSVLHWEHRFPVCPLQYPLILERAFAALPQDAEQNGELIAITERLRSLGANGDVQRDDLPAEGDALKARLAAVAASPVIAEAINRAVEVINGAPGVSESFGVLHRLLEEQPYRLAHWRIASSDINYRRFFDINSLAGLRIEEPELFAKAHEMVFRLVEEDHIHGLRIDHIDGLADPAAYTRALQDAVGPNFYIVVEKILEPGEHLRDWPVAGTTGYDVLNMLDGVFVDHDAAKVFDKLYRRMTGREGRFSELLRRTKREILETSFASELEVLTSDVKRVADANRRTRDYSANALRRALVEIVARFPVYRTYLDGGEIAAEDRELLDSTLSRAKRATSLPDTSVHDFIGSVLLDDVEADGSRDGVLVRRFRTRFQQLTGPVMAKSLEDTLFYRHVPLVSLNEVGSDPDHFGMVPEAFHEAMAERATTWPQAMTATATHDTKRGEDARARLNTLAEMPREWLRAVGDARRIADRFITDIDGEAAPDANDRYLILQGILGAWPVELLDELDPSQIKDFRSRIEAWVEKALREAKRKTSWINPDEAYETAARDLVGGLLNEKSDFLESFQPLARRLAYAGVITSLARTALKFTVPGVPETYQGTEGWDLSLVDPDNRRPVDYTARNAGLARSADLRALLADWHNGRVKLALTQRLLSLRAEMPELMAHGDYRAIQAEGEKADHILAFSREHGGERIVVVVPRLVSAMIKDENLPASAWSDTRLPLPAGRWTNVLTGANLTLATGVAHTCRELFAEFPIAVLKEEPA
jgi:(1->4)-alpha-D-glucan 1-alpha-D-glucosylmutase